MNHIKSIIFDFDNTIAQTTEPIDFSVLGILKKYSPITDEQFLLDTIRKATTNYQICEKLVPKNNLEDVYQQILQVNRENVKKAFYHPEMVDVIRKLNEDYSLHIVSGRDVLSLTSSLIKYKLKSCFYEIIGGDSGFHAKPSSEALEYIINKYNNHPSEVIYIGDSKTDYIAAKEAKCYFINACWYKENIFEEENIICYDPQHLLQMIQSF